MKDILLLAPGALCTTWYACEKKAGWRALLICSQYRNVWAPMLKYRDNFAQETPPEGWALEFRQSVEDVFLQNRGPALRRAIARLMKHP